MYNLSNRDTSLSLRTPLRSAQFFYKSSVAWNSVNKKVLEKPHCDLTTKISHFKKEMKKFVSQNKTRETK